jgi:hypothetical protein
MQVFSLCPPHTVPDALAARIRHIEGLDELDRLLHPGRGP